MGESAGDETLKVLHLGLQPYSKVMEIQRVFRQKLLAGAPCEVILTTEHLPVMTVGRSGGMEDLLVAREFLDVMGIEVVHANRGGKMVYHGPGQVVVYPVLDLTKRGCNLRRYVRTLEDACVAAAEHFGVIAHAGGDRGTVGVFVEKAKLGYVGIAASKWITQHGLALNVANDLRVFEFFTQCGLKGVPATRLSDFAEVGVEQAREALVAELLHRLRADRFTEPRDRVAPPLGAATGSSGKVEACTGVS